MERLNMDDETYALIQQQKSAYDDSINRIKKLENQRRILISILQRNSISIPEDILSDFLIDEETEKPLV